MIAVGLLDAEAAWQKVPIPTDGSAHMITAGAIRIGDVAHWVGIDRPPGDENLWVTLKAPEVQEPNLRWAYTTATGTWQWEPEGAVSCFNHTDLVAMRWEDAKSLDGEPGSAATRTVTMHGGPWDGRRIEVADDVGYALTLAEDGWTRVVYEPRERGALDWHMRVGHGK